MTTSRLFAVVLTSFMMLSAAAVTDELDQLTDSLLDADPALKLKSAEYASTWLDARSENQLADPEFGFDHYWSRPNVGRKYTLQVSQSFDWPGLYGKRSRYASAVKLSGEASLMADRAERASELRALIIDYAYYRELSILTSIQARLYESIALTMEQEVDSGNVTQIDLNKARLEAMSAKRRQRQAEQGYQEALSSLVAANGGRALPLDRLNRIALPAPADLRPLAYYVEAAAQAPAIAAKRQQAAASAAGLSVAKAGRLPQFSLGYAYNNEFGDNFHGITGSVTLPVYSRRSQVAAAEERRQALTADLDAASAVVTADVEAAYRRAERLSSEIAQQEAVLGQNSIVPLLTEQLEAGVITALDSSREADFQLSYQAEQLETRYEFAQAHNALRTLAGE